jgi:methyl-accepting chemotaxis protein
MSIKRRILTLPVLATVVLAIGLAVSLSFTTGALSSIKKTETADYPVLAKTKALELDVNSLTAGFKDAVSEGDKSKVPELEKKSEKIKEEIKALISISNDSKEYDLVYKELDVYSKVALSVTKKMLSMEDGDAIPLIPEMQSSLKTLESHLGKLNDLARKQFNDGITKSQQGVSNVLTTSILISVITSLIITTACLLVIRVIFQQLGGEPDYTRQIASTIASGDLSKDIFFDKKHSNSLLFAMKEMQEKLASMINDIKISSVTIKKSSIEIADGNNSLSERTKSQASSIDETISAMEELTTTVKKNAENAKIANELVIKSSDIAIKGGKVVSEVIETMKDINDSSKKISDIISVIDGIAFQTNILALNAAVEAARAGEQGRGFAVVATEVRNLAQRSASAAKEIKTLINVSSEKVKNGTVLVDAAGKTMEDIVFSVNKVTDIMHEISAASNGQILGIVEVNKAINSMDQATQQNSALVGESAASAHVMQDQANILVETISIFKVSSFADEDSNQPRIAAQTNKNLLLKFGG